MTGSCRRLKRVVSTRIFSDGLWVSLMAAIVLRSWFIPSNAKLLLSIGMITLSATTNALTVAARIAGGVSIRITS